MKPFRKHVAIAIDGGGIRSGERFQFVQARHPPGAGSYHQYHHGICNIHYWNQVRWYFCPGYLPFSGDIRRMVGSGSNLHHCYQSEKWENHFTETYWGIKTSHRFTRKCK